MSVMVCKDINKVYSGGVHAVKNFNIEIEEGEFVVLVGPSGCGKSTLLRMIAGLEGITDGDLIIEGEKVNHLSPSERDIAMVFQNYALYGNMTVYENMGFSMTIRKENTDKIHESVMKVSDVVNLRNLLKRKPKALSGGQKQRVALGRAIVRDANIFLMDEPLSNLDAKLRNVTRKEIVSLHQKLGSTFIYVTHDQVEALTMADRIVIMKDGIAQQIGTPRDIYQNPANVFVGGFIGSPPMNFIEGKVEKGQFVSKNMVFKIPEDRQAILEYEGKPIILGVRPENFKLINEKVENMFRSTHIVDAIECLGADLLVYFLIDNVQMIAKTSANERIHMGDSIQLSVDLDHIHFFDSQTELRIK
jgi:multiple sugar transport system ATP-binding protein